MTWLLLSFCSWSQATRPESQAWIAELRRRIPEVKRKLLVTTQPGKGANKTKPGSKGNRPRSSIEKGGVVTADPTNHGAAPSLANSTPPSVYGQKFAQAIGLLQRAKYPEIIQNTRDAFWFTLPEQEPNRWYGAMALAIAYFRMGDTVEALRCTRDYLAPNGFPPDEVDQVAGCIAYFQGMNLPGLKQFLLDQVDPLDRKYVEGNSIPERKALAILALNNGCQWVRGSGWDSFCDMGASIQFDNPLFIESWVRQAMGGDTLERIMADSKRGILRLAPLERVEKVYQRFLPLVAQDPERTRRFKNQLDYYGFLKWDFRQTAVKNGWKP
jgi:hypothetical protein